MTADVDTRTWVLTGEPFLVTITADATCPAAERREHFVLVLDGSGSMSKGGKAEQQAAALEFVRELQLASHPQRKVGIVEYATAARTLCQPINDAGKVEACIRRIGAAGTTRFDLGLAEARDALQNIPRAPGERAAAAEHIILVAQAQIPDPLHCANALFHATRAASSGVQVAAVCLGPTCDASCISPLASRPDLFYDVPDPRASAPTFRTLAQQLVTTRVLDSDLSIKLSDGFEVVPDSPTPPADTVTSDSISWPLTVGGGPRSFEARATRPGTRALFETARMSGIDALGTPYDTSVESPVVSAFGGSPLGAGGARPFSTDRETELKNRGAPLLKDRATAHGSPEMGTGNTAPLTMDSESISRLAELNQDCVVSMEVGAPPFALQGEPIPVELRLNATCPAARPPYHIVLALDGREPQSSISAHQHTGVEQFLRLLELDQHPERQVAIVGHGSRALVYGSLTNSRERILGAASRIHEAGETRLDLALQSSLRVILAGRRSLPDRDLVAEWVVLTSHSDTSDPARCSAAEVESRKLAGQSIRVAALCLGPDCTTSCMRRVATPDHLLFHAPTEADVTPTFESAANAILSERLRRSLVDVIVDPAFEIVPGSAGQKGIFRPPQRITWESFSDAPTLTFEVRGVRPGTHRLFESSDVIAQTLGGHSVALSFPSPVVGVMSASQAP